MKPVLILHPHTRDQLAERLGADKVPEHVLAKKLPVYTTPGSSSISIAAQQRAAPAVFWKIVKECLQ